MNKWKNLEQVKEFNNAFDAVEYLTYLYDKTVCSVKIFESKDDFKYDARYPFIGLKIENPCTDPKQSHGCVFEPGYYGATVTRPDVFYNYYIEQLSLLIKNHNVSVFVGISKNIIPIPYALEHGTEDLNDDQMWVLKSGFVLPNLSRINDNIANNKYKHETIKPLALFDGERTDFSLHRLYHYTGTSAEHFQGFILLTNYQRYIKTFIEYSKKQILNDSDYTEIRGPGDFFLNRDNINEELQTLDHLPQMPAYHLKRKDGLGISFINIGVGPSNAKNITDHLAVLRPHCWLMIGHCAGLRSTQALGDYVLAHGYVREDHVLDQDVPIWVPIPPLAEVQVALHQAIMNFSKEESLKENCRTGTVVTTGNRNWELSSSELYDRFRQSRAIAIDMESATIAANGMRFRVPYGTLLCVSDKPIHGELKLHGMANAFYKQRVKQHLDIGIEAIRILRESGIDPLHSRKLRGFDDPPFR